MLGYVLALKGCYLGHDVWYSVRFGLGLSQTHLVKDLGLSRLDFLIDPGGLSTNRVFLS